MSLSSCFCRRTRFCVWTCSSWTCWAIALSFSGYIWASKERICHAGQEGVAVLHQNLVKISPGVCESPLHLPHQAVTWSSSIILTVRSFSSCCLSSIISLLRSSVFSSSRMSGEPIPSSFSSARLLFGEEPLNSWRTQAKIENTWFRCALKLQRRLRIFMHTALTCMIRLSWLFCCSSRVFSCSKVKMYSAVCCKMAAWRTSVRLEQRVQTHTATVLWRKCWYPP